MISRSFLSRALGKVVGFSKPKIKLRQYMTPPAIASELLWTAYMSNDIEGRVVFDLGCGTGMLSIAAALLGGKVTGFDIDGEVIIQALSNAKSINVPLLVFELDVSEVTGYCDTVIMNPPFMVRGGKNDRVFLSKAFSLCDRVYSIHTTKTREWVFKFAKLNGFTADLISEREFLLSKEFVHQSKEKGVQKVDLWYFHK